MIFNVGGLANFATVTGFSVMFSFPRLRDRLLLFFAISVGVVGAVWMKEVGSDHL